MSLLDATYFVGELSLPLIATSTDEGEKKGVAAAMQAVGENNLGVFIDKYEVDYLVRLFGREFATTFIDEVNKDNPAEIWLNLKNQLLIEIGTYKASPLANYVYYWIMRDARTKTTQAGEADPTFDNAKNANNNQKMVKAWNDMVGMTWDVIKWFCNNIKDYRDYLGAETGRNICSLVKNINTFGI